MIYIGGNSNESRCQLYLKLTTRIDISTMKSESEVRLSHTSAYLRRISQQLLPPPYVTMCSHHISTRVTCLDSCLQSSFNYDGRLVEMINRTANKGIENREWTGQKCQSKYAEQPCTGSFFVSAKYRVANDLSLIAMSLTEQKLVTSPRMAFDELLINLLKVIGIFLGLSISDCITSLINGLTWLNNQRISYMTRRKIVHRWAWRVSSD